MREADTPGGHAEQKLRPGTGPHENSGPGKRADGGQPASALQTSARQFGVMLPTLLGVVLLIGLFKTLVFQDSIGSVFSAKPFWDMLAGAALGSLFTGNAINSYLIGGTLLDAGVTISAVAAFIFTWVSVGVVQLPAEASALGTRFAVTRNGAALVLAIPIALLTSLLLQVFA